LGLKGGDAALVGGEFDGDAGGELPQIVADVLSPRQFVLNLRID
jgi:hypothetical protein